jgi:ubiquinone/menaquinone biosynthesis C-methylase UbiE
MKKVDYTEMVRIVYDNVAEKYHNQFRFEMDQKEFDRLFLDKFSKQLGISTRILDAGCGPSGHIGKYLFDKGHIIVGIDISPKCIEIASKYNSELDYVVMDMANMTFGKNYFDAILAYYSIMYTPKNSVDKIISEFYRVLKPNGKLLIVLKKGFSDEVLEDYWDEGNPVYYTLYQETEIQNILIRNKFSIQHIETRTPYDFELKIDRIYIIATKEI